MFTIKTANDKQHYLANSCRTVLFADLWEVDADGVVVPLAVTDVGELPSPLSWLEDVHVSAL